MTKRILINFPTNIGDTILALIVLDKVKSNYPDSKIIAIASPRTKDFLECCSLVDGTVIFDKASKAIAKLNFSLKLRGKFDIIVDLKNSFLPILLGIKIRTPFRRQFSDKVHIVDKYLKIIEKIAPNPITIRNKIVLSDERREYWDKLIPESAIFLACTSLSKIKQYPSHLVKEVVEKTETRIIVLGQDSERDFYRDIMNFEKVIDLVGKTKMSDIYYLLQKFARVVIGVDSSITHLASYLNIPVIAFFGPTSFERSYPRSKRSVILKREDLECVPCEMASCDKDIECMNIAASRVVGAIKEIINN